MNMPTDRHEPKRTPHELEWQAQEHALEQERRGLPLDDADPRLAEYRLIARALRSPAMEPPPFDLADGIVRHVEASIALGERLERWLLRVLGAIFAIAVVAVVVAYGAQWMPAFARLWPSLSPQSADWAGLLVGCLTVSLAWQGVVRLMRADVEMPVGLA